MNYSKLNKTQLLDLAAEQGLEVDETMTNEQIIAILKQNTSDETEEVETEEVVEAPKVAIAKTLKVAEKEEGQVFAGIYGTDSEISEKLSQEETIPVYIPLDIGEEQGTQQPVIINGYQFNILKGQVVYCPKSIAEIVSYAQIKVSNNEFINLEQR